MPVPNRVLRPGERVVLDIRPHGWCLVAPCLVAAAVLAGAVVAGVEGVPTVAAWGIVAVLALALARLLLRYLRWITTSLVLTTDRLIQRSGVLGRRSREIPVEQFTDVGYRQRMLERLVGIGDLVVESAGRQSAESFVGLPHPETIQREIYNQMEASRLRRSGYLVERSIPEQIDQLADLARRGILTAAEFEAKKSQLLDRL